MLNSYIIICLSENLIPFMNLLLNITQCFLVGWWPFLSMHVLLYVVQVCVAVQVHCTPL